jgi:selenide, water dikinase
MNQELQYKLTKYVHGGGCGCKIAPAVLEQILKTGTPTPSFPNLLVGNQSKDDAAVYKLNDDTCVISTTDFFMPIVNDAFQFGKIASANAISDIYAMGGKPMMAIAILGWPIEKLPVSLAQQVMDGARAICMEAGIPLAGGHSIDATEPIFGLAVTGSCDVNTLKKNDTAQEGDFLFLTKPIGVGILATAEKKGVITPEHYSIFIQQLTQLNKIGERLGAVAGVHAMTDVTGFGLAGHLTEMAEGSQLTAVLNYSAIKIVPGSREYLAQNMNPGATSRNWAAYGKKIKFDEGINVMEAFYLLPDPQTNGGLLLSVAPNAVDEVKSILIAEGYANFVTPIGRFIAREENLIVVNM